MRAWIRSIDETEATGPLAAQYEAGIRRAGKVFNIVKIMGLNPQALGASMGFYRSLMFGASGLSRAEREICAVVVSRANDCFY